MGDSLWPLLLCVAAGLAWYDALRARERAVAQAKRLCAEHGAQMLDQTVALHRLRLSWRGGRLRLLRGYRFELSYNGDDRQRGSLTLLGSDFAGYSLPAIPGEPFASADVIDLHTRARRTLH